MKTDRRHELQTNQLADWLAHTIERLRPYSRAIMGAVLALVVAVIVWTYVQRQQRAALDARWDQFYQNSGNRQALMQMADQSAIGTPMGDLTRLMISDAQLGEGINALFVNRAEGVEQLDKAIENYSTFLSSSKDEMIRQKAVFGLARAHESLNQLERARAEYKQLADWPNCSYSALAKQRYEDLSNPATKEWYAWFAKQEPRPPAIDGPGTPGQKPSFETTQPDGPDIKLPSVGSGLLNDGDGAAKPDDKSAAPAGAPASTPQKSP